MNNSPSRLFGWLAISIGITIFLSDAILFYGWSFHIYNRPPLWRLSAFVILIAALLNPMQVWLFHRSFHPQPLGMRKLILITGMIASLIILIGSVQSALDNIGVYDLVIWFPLSQTGSILVMGYGFLGIWLLSLNVLALLQDTGSRSQACWGIMAGMVMSIGLLAIPRVFVPYVSLYHLSVPENGELIGYLGWKLLYPIWSIGFEGQPLQNFGQLKRKTFSRRLAWVLPILTILVLAGREVNSRRYVEEEKISEISTLRVLMEPVSITRAGTLVTVEQAALDSEGTEIVYSYKLQNEIIINPQTAEVDSRSPVLVLPDGTRLEPIFESQTRDCSECDARYLMEFDPIPVGVDEAILELPDLVGSPVGYAVKDWKFQLKFKAPDPSEIVSEYQPRATSTAASTFVETPRCIEKLIPPIITDVQPSPALPGSEMTIMGTGGYIQDSCGGFNESARVFELYLDNEYFGDLQCYIHQCQANIRLADTTASGSHCLSTQKDICEFEFQVMQE